MAWASGVISMTGCSHPGYELIGKKVPENRNMGSSQKFSQFSCWNEVMYDVQAMPIAEKAKAMSTAAGMVSRAHQVGTSPKTAVTDMKPTA
ncbi:unannotated protein [freshwater metagenome]|uniref:Unannotated protein n=1 Tax=freshwater metagenome TaxID=449393 RepID=A0A6J7P3B6_9ZZZZ